MRLDKLRADPARDAQRLAELRPLEQRYWRRVAERKGAARRAPRRVPLAARGAARQPVRAGAAHAAAGERQAAAEGLGADRGLGSAPRLAYSRALPVAWCRLKENSNAVRLDGDRRFLRRSRRAGVAAWRPEARSHLDRRARHRRLAGRRLPRPVDRAGIRPVRAPASSARWSARSWCCSSTPRSSAKGALPPLEPPPAAAR